MPSPAPLARTVDRLRPLATSRAGLIVLAALALALVVAHLPPPIGAAPRAMTALGLTAFVVTLWATIAVPQPYAAAAFLALVLATGAAAPDRALAGFTTSSLWLVFGGLLIGTAAERSGLGRIVARRFLGGFTGSWPGLVAGVLVGTTLLSFLVPANMGRLAITIPVVMALCRDAGYAEGSPGWNGLMLTAVVGNFTVALAILPANLLNVMIVGSGEALYGVSFAYVTYLWLCGPVLGLVKGLVVWAAVVAMFRAPAPGRPAAEEAVRLGSDAMRVGLILTTAIAFWATDVWHGIRPGWVALAAGLVCLVPGVGTLPLKEGLDPKKLLIMVWVGTVLSLGAILGDSGAAALVSKALAGVSGVSGQSPTYAYFALAVMTSVLAAVGTVGGAIPIVTAAIGDISALTGLPVPTAVLSVVAGASALFFPFVAAPVVVGLAMGRVAVRPATRFMVVVALMTLVVVLPLNAAWWWVTGVLK
ncbi:MAG: anion permease [Hyphomicrobiaceae bacterium]